MTIHRATVWEFTPDEMAPPAPQLQDLLDAVFEGQSVAHWKVFGMYGTNPSDAHEPWLDQAVLLVMPNQRNGWLFSLDAMPWLTVLQEVCWLLTYAALHTKEFTVESAADGKYLVKGLEIKA